MRIRSLELLAFGPFSGARLEFAGAPGTVDLVYGPNEAGKSTTLRAISGLLFGIPLSTRDAHRHAPSELRLGGRIVRANGEVLDVVRRKGKKETLLDSSGRPLAEDVLRAALGGLSEEIFSAMFGLDHDALRAGAEAMLAGRGRVGESLFAAGAGATRVHALRKRLAAEAETLYTPRGRDKRLVVRALQDVREARKKIDELSTTARGYLEHDQGVESARRERRELRERLQALATEQSRLQRLLQIVPDLTRRAEVLGKLRELGDVVALAEDASERRVSAVQALDEARRARERVAEDLDRLENERRGLVVTESLLALDETVIRDLDARRGRHLSAESDMPKRLAKLAALEASVAAALGEVGQGPSRADLDKVRLGVARAPTIRRLATDRAALATELRRLERGVATLAAKCEHVASGLGATLGAEQAAAARSALERPAELAVPAAETVARFAAREERALMDGAALDEESERLREEQRTVAKHLEALERAGKVLAEPDLDGARTRRDALFAETRAAVENGARAPARLLDDYEESVRVADDVADRLRREADRVAQRAGLLAEGAALDGRLRALAEKTTELSARTAEGRREWAALWRSAGFSPLPPGEMRGWVATFADLVGFEGERRERLAELDSAREELREWQTEWSKNMAELGVEADASAERAMAFLDAGAELFRRVAARDEMQGRIDAMRRDSEQFARAADELCRLHLPEAGGLPAAEAAHRLVRAHEAARRADETRRRLDGEIAERRQRLSIVEGAERDARADVARLLSSAGVSDLSALEVAERKSAAARELSNELTRLEALLVERGDGATPDELVRATRDIDVDRARARLEELRTDLDQVTESLQSSAAFIASAEAGSSRFGGSAAAEAADALAAAGSRLKRHTNRYLRVRIASLLLDREIERYRIENQGPIVARASALLSELTAGRYAGLSTDFGANDQAVLLAAGPDGDVPIDGLSEGTRDQLYLALRLASLERFLEFNEPMPLVLDDILIQSDDDRARAAFRVLAGVARRTQVLFFTHHARLLDIAREELGPEALSEHTLSAPEARAVLAAAD